VDDDPQSDLDGDEVVFELHSLLFEVLLEFQSSLLVEGVFQVLREDVLLFVEEPPQSSLVVEAVGFEDVQLSRDEVF